MAAKETGAWCAQCFRNAGGLNPHLVHHSRGGEDVGTLPFRPGKTARKRRAGVVTRRAAA